MSRLGLSRPWRPCLPSGSFVVSKVRISFLLFDVISYFCKIYIKINASGYSSVKIPDLIDKTYREAVPTLKTLGLEEGTVTYIPNIGKDMVLEMRFRGRNLKVGDRVLKSSKIS